METTVTTRTTVVASAVVKTAKRQLTQELELAVEQFQRGGMFQPNSTAKYADEVEQIVAVESVEMELFGRERLSFKILATRQALDRIAQGVYGICVECEKAISAKRLKAAPTVALCKECQDEQDKNEGGSHRPIISRVFGKHVTRVGDTETADYLRGYAREN